MNDTKPTSNTYDINKIKETIKRIKSSPTTSNHVNKWPKNTILVASDSMLSGLDERRLGRNNYKVKVRCFKGSTVGDMYHYLYPLLQKEPDYLILHVGTNDCTHHTSEKVFNDLLALKRHIEVKVPAIKVLFSLPISRFDNRVIA